MNIGPALRHRRLELGKTQEELALALGYSSRSAIAKIESGKADIPLSKLILLTRELDTTIDSLLAESTFKTAQPNPIEKNKAQLDNRAGAVVLAGGKSSRNLQNVPNQFVNILGKPVIVYVLEAYQRHPLIDDIVVVSLKEWNEVLRAYISKYGLTKIKSIVLPGQSSVESAKNGLQALCDEHGYRSDDIAVFQGATRPLITEEAISKILEECSRKGSAITCEPLDDRISFVKKNDRFEYVNRNDLYEIQSPEAYKVNVIHRILDEAEKADLCTTSNNFAIVMSRLGYDLNLCGGPRNNMRLLRREDIAIATTLLKQRTC